MNRLFLLALLLLIMPLVSADLGTFKQDSCVEIKTILPTNIVNISTLSYPNSTLALSNVEMTKIGSTFNYTFCQTNDFGSYIYDYFDSDGNVYVNNFNINAQGKEYSSAVGIIYLALFGLLTGLFFLFLYIFVATPYNNPTGEEGQIIAIDKKKYLKLFSFALAYTSLVAISYFAWNISFGILEFVEMANFFYVIFRVLLIGILVTIPVVFTLGVISFIRDSKIREMLERGFEQNG